MTSGELLGRTLWRFSRGSVSTVPKRQAGLISQEVSDLTGITDEVVAGQRIDGAAVEAFVADAVVVLAHNVAFDRKFAERYWPVFERKAWGCSATEVEWRGHGFEGSRLSYLLNGAGLLHQTHRAVDDCHALLQVLARELPTTRAPALALLLERARKRTVRPEGRAEAPRVPLERREARVLVRGRRRGRSRGRGRVLRTEVYRRDVEPWLQTLTAFTRFSVRA